MSNNFAINRNIFEHPLFTTAKGKPREPYTWREAWIWMIGNACWEDKDIFISGHRVTLKRGQLSFSFRFLAEKWAWDTSKVQRFIHAIKTDTMIDTATDTGQTIITICNYNDYQLVPGYNDTPTDTPTDTEVSQVRYKEEYLNTLNTNKDSLLDFGNLEQKNPPKAQAERFEEFREIFPKQRPGSWENAKKAYVKALKRSPAEEIISGTRRYAQSDEVKRGFAKGAAAWLNDDRWKNDYSAAPAPKPAQQGQQPMRPSNPVKSRKIIL